MSRTLTGCGFSFKEGIDMKVTVLKPFTDKNTLKGYNAGYVYESDDVNRLKLLAKKGFVTPVEEPKAPEVPEVKPKKAKSDKA